MSRTFLVLIFLALVPAFAWAQELPAPDVKPLAAVAEVTVYSLAGDESHVKPRMGPKLHGYRILGQAQLKDADAKRAANIVSAAVQSGQGVSSCVFDPHHALRVVSGGHVYDYLVCYHCGDVMLWDGDKEIGIIGGIAKTPDGLNALLTAAHVPLAPIYDKAADDAAFAQKLSKMIEEIQTGKTVKARTDAAEHLAEVTHDTNHSFSHETVAEITALMDSPDDSVRYWVARCLGNIGPSASSAAPKLEDVLARVDCLQGEKTSASGIRFALEAMGIEPPATQCGGR
jgi:hypothetical protein